MYVETQSAHLHWLWRAVDAAGDVLDILVQTRRNAKAAKRFLARLISQFGHPRVVITDKLRSFTKPVAHQAPSADQRGHKGLNGIAKLFGPTDLATGWNMKIPASMPRLKGFRHPRGFVDGLDAPSRRHRNVPL